MSVTDIRPLIGIAASRPLTGSEAEAAFDAIGRRPAVLEAAAVFQRELSIIAARGHDGAEAGVPGDLPADEALRPQAGTGCRSRGRGDAGPEDDGVGERVAGRDAVAEHCRRRGPGRPRRALGDDGLLRAVTGELEGEGFRVVATQDVFRDLLTPAGNLGAFAPDAQAEVDIARGVEVIRALGHLDVGQAVIVQQGIVLGVEAIEGTDALITRCGALRREGRGGVLVKLVKPDQDRSLDMPSLGPATVRMAVQAGLAGIAFEARGALVIQREDMIRVADENEIFLLAIRPEDYAAR